MKNRLLFFASICLLAASCGGNSSKSDPPEPYGPIPTDAQLAWHEMEMYCLVHFGVDTYTDKEWGYGDEDPAIFNPVEFDAGQIVRAAKAGGFKGVIVVAKHHDGLCLWPTKTTTHNISKTPYKGGKGDIIAEFRKACDQEGMKLGLYCSPWDRNSPYYGKPEYVSIYREQLKELYGNYGPLFISWHDGANGGDGYYGGTREERKIDRSTYYGWDSTWAITRKMQPGAVIFGDVGPDVRWVGNEQGIAGRTCWATYTPQAPDSLKLPSNGYVKYWEGVEGTRDGKYWMPAECDVPLRPGWFYHASQDSQVKDHGELLNLYYNSVGRGANLDLGIAPDRRGLLHANDVRSLKEFGDALKETFAVNLAAGANISASNIRHDGYKTYDLLNLVDNDRYSYWATDDSVTTAEFTLNFNETKSFNVIRLRENIKLGQRIDSFAVDIFTTGKKWKQIAIGTSIGANRLIRLNNVEYTESVRIRILGAKACIALSDIGLFKELGIIEMPAGYFRNRYYGMHKTDWKIMGTGVGDPAAVIDDNENTITGATGNIIIDMGNTQTVKAFLYLPRQDTKKEGIVDKYSYAVSKDGKSWQEVATGEFGNIRTNPVWQVTELAKPVQARYIKFSALHITDGASMTVAEIGVRNN